MVTAVRAATNQGFPYIFGQNIVISLMHRPNSHLYDHSQVCPTDTPYSRATSLLLRPSTGTDVTTSCAIPIAQPLSSGCKRCPETAVNDVVNSRTPSDTRKRRRNATCSRCELPSPTTYFAATRWGIARSGGFLADRCADLPSVEMGCGGWPLHVGAEVAPPHPRAKPNAGTAPRTGRSLPSPRDAAKPVVNWDLTNSTDDGENDA
jgi:hypothetical protein